jgi:serine/threonine-protein kinase
VDFIINRTLVYGALTAALVFVFGLVLIAANAVFNAITAGEQNTLGMLLSALAAGALFQPTRKALQRFVDRTFYRIKIDYLKTPAKAKSQNFSDTQTQAPLLFSSYRDLALIGKGGMAEIYRAEHPTLSRTVAIKVLLSNLAEDEQFRKRFMREAETVSRLEHRNIVKLFDYGEENGLYYMVMEYLDGANLSATLRQKGRISLDDALPILKDVAGALDYAHSAGLIHRDVKPSNVMLDSGFDAPRAVLTDFGIAKISGPYTKITASAVLGTFDYIAPEQIQAAADVDCRADIYALGVMTYQFLTGVLPFQRPGVGALLMAHLSAPPPDASELAPSLSRRTSTAIQKAMSKKPADRFASAGEFVAALE